MRLLVSHEQNIFRAFADGRFVISHVRAKVRRMDAKTQKSELTRTAIVGAAMNLALAEGLEAITLQAVASRLGLSKSGVFSRVGSREALQKAVIEEYGRGFLADVFVPAMQKPKGLPRLNDIVARWIARTRDVEMHTGCLYMAGAFEFDDREGELRDVLFDEITRWRAALRRTVMLAVETGELKGRHRPRTTRQRNERRDDDPAARRALPARPAGRRPRHADLAAASFQLPRLIREEAG
jgi:AcrR family transcriptional regulator